MGSRVNNLVHVNCMTYNQSAYITDAMNGFVMQQTDFPFVCSIIDDASTDGEQTVISEYVGKNFDLQDKSVAYEKELDFGRVFFAQHKTNKNCYFAVIFLKENHYSQKKPKAPYLTEWMDAKYVALCEGDDYWTDPLKLQKQVAFLESHEDFTMCFHGSDIRNDSNREVWIHCDTIETREYFPDDVFPTWVPHTSSFLYRKETKDSFQIQHKEWLESGDTVIVLACMHLGRVWGMKEHMSVYRMNNNSVMRNSNGIDSMGRYVQHLKCFLLNFPKIDKEYCYMEICTYDYDRFKNRDGKKNRWYYLFDAVKTSPKYMFKMYKRRIKSALKKVK